MDIKSIFIATFVLFFLFIGPIYYLAIRPVANVAETEPVAAFDAAGVCVLHENGGDSMRSLSGEIVSVEGTVAEREFKKGFLKVWIQNSNCGMMQLDMDPAFAGADDEFGQPGSTVRVKGRVASGFLGRPSQPSRNGQPVSLHLEQVMGD